jgi:hypothetical protein
MSLFEEDMNKVPRAPVYQYSFTRSRSGQGDQQVILATDTEEFAHSLELLRNTSLHLSLFKIILSDLKPEAACKVIQLAFGNRSMISAFFRWLRRPADRDGDQETDHQCDDGPAAPCRFGGVGPEFASGDRRYPPSRS